jgi:hypothetical protein
MISSAVKIKSTNYSFLFCKEERDFPFKFDVFKRGRNEMQSKANGFMYLIICCLNDILIHCNLHAMRIQYNALSKRN